jgi:hypothetical protein
MKPILSLILIIPLHLSLILNAQSSDYKDGFVILKSGDTLFGQVKDRSEEPFGKLFKKIRLKREGKLFKKRFCPADLKKYKKGSDIFESIWLKETAELFKFCYYSQEGMGEEVFLKVILSGELTYYHQEWRDPESGYYLYIPFFKKNGNYELVRITQGLFGLRREAVATYLSDKPELAERIRSSEKLSAYYITELYNKEL